jgi:hypothetical protein
MVGHPNILRRARRGEGVWVERQHACTHTHSAHTHTHCTAMCLDYMAMYLEYIAKHFSFPIFAQPPTSICAKQPD